MLRPAVLPALLTLVLLLPGCTGVRRLVTPTPHERYVAMLRDSGLDQSALGRDWVHASEQALRQPVAIATPFRETGYIPAAEPVAVGYRIDLERGRRLTVDVTFESSTPARLFVDLFRARPDHEPERVATIEGDEAALDYEVDRNGAYILRLQPELLRGGRFTIVQRTLASLRFPIPDRTADTVQSIFGDERDAGARSHQGVDIFVPRGTPVVAVTSGVARTGTNNLGGNVVWLQDAGDGRSFYYAHLDRWAIDGFARVQAGDVLGFVGNTGNARSTPPHLHFGIYDRGAIDPLPFLRPDDPMPVARAEGTGLLGELVRAARSDLPLRRGPDARREAVVELERHTIARVLGTSGTWLRVSLPDDVNGYVEGKSIAPLGSPVARERLAGGAALLDAPASTAATIESIADGTRVDVLGRFGEFRLLRTEGGRTGWIGPMPVEATTGR
jgi:murein DD-endopeptidase MepM/ murein hydrolase activator NlpD